MDQLQLIRGYTCPLWRASVRLSHFKTTAKMTLLTKFQMNRIHKNKDSPFFILTQTIVPEETPLTATLFIKIQK
jgi:hypothetical protein